MIWVIIIKQYICHETNIITENPYKGIESGFCIVEKYDFTYQKELPRFKKINFRAYALPYNDNPEKKYQGIGNLPQTKDNPPESYWEIGGLLQSENEIFDLREKIYNPANCDVVWVKIHGSLKHIPTGYCFCGYDITYEPDFDGAFSIINDCMFICKWHGCDEEGVEFSDYFKSLNYNGLFDKTETALDYMKHYLSFDWSERGEYCISEIYRQAN